MGGYECMVKKYQIFISATYEDLKEERKKVQDTILSMSQFPAGMEMFSASNEEPWEIIREAIDNSDFYVLIIGHKYGSVIEVGKYAGISYTQREYYYALERKIPVFVFLIDNSVLITPNRMEQETAKREKLEAFKKEIMSRHHVVWWKNEDDLAYKVSVAFSNKFNNEQEYEQIIEQRSELEGKKIGLGLKGVDENEWESQKAIEFRHHMEQDNLVIGVSNVLSKEINEEKNLESMGEQCLKKNESERGRSGLGQQGKEVNENKQEFQKRTIGLVDKNIGLQRTKKIENLIIGIIGITVVLIFLRDFSWISRDKEIMPTNENAELNEDSVHENQNIELNKDNQDSESVEVNNDNKGNENMGGEIQSLEENGKNSEVIDWEWEYADNADDVRIYLKNTPSELGIDVSKYQGTIDWEKVKADGIDFAIIRVGSRGYGSGELYSDSKFKENMDGAITNGIKTGVYFYSQATDRDEVDEEIDKILKDIEGYRLDYPIGVELICEGDDYRTYELSTMEHQEEYIELIKYFCNSIKQNGYTPMIYGTMEWFQQFPEGSFDGYYKWICSLGVEPKNIDNCIIWQYEEGMDVVDGISHVSVDLSVYNGENK